MKKSLLFLSLMLSLGIKSQIVNIPDANFKAKLLSSSPSNTVAKNLNGNYFAIDANNDGQIQQSEAEQVGELTLIDDETTSIDDISSYQGILSLSNIQKMKIENFVGPATPLDISNLNSLTDVDILSSHPIVFSGTPVLKNVSINILSDLTSPSAISTFSNTLASLESINSLEKLVLRYQGNNIIVPLSFNLNNHSNLKEVIIDNIGLTKLDLNHCNLLNSVSISDSYFEEVNISYSPAIISFLANFTYVNKLVADNCLNLQTISIHKTPTLTINNCPQLSEINIRDLGKDAANTPIVAINCPNIKTLTLGYKYPSFDVTPFINLEHLSFNTYSPFANDPAFNDDLQNLTINNNVNLKTLNIVNYKKINHLNFNGLTKLESVGFSVNYNPNMVPPFDFSTDFLQSLNIQNCPLLTTISLSEQRGLKTAVVKNCPKLISFMPVSSNPSSNSLESVEIDNCALLNFVGVYNAKLTNLKILNCPALQVLVACYNLLTSVDLTNSTASIKELVLSHNNLTSFNNVLSFPNLESLYLGGNKIVDLDLSNHNKISLLEYVDQGYYYPGPQVNPPTFLKTVNLNGCSNLEIVDLESSVLEKVFLKNGKNEWLSITNSPGLQYICCDASQMSDVQSLVNQYGYTNCTVTSSCNVGPVLSTSENSSNPTTIKVHPNPTKGDVTINADSKIKSVEIYDTQGRIIQKQTGINSQEAKVSIHSSVVGVYLFKIVTEKESITKKVIKN